MNSKSKIIYNYSSIKEAALMAKQNRTAQISRNIELREVMKIK